MSYEIINSDCLKAMQKMPDGSVAAIVTDPPYGLAFMGANWDHNVPSVSYWSECLRVAKSGAHLLCFGGTRTFHRMTCAIEDAGWEIRDTIMWVYGSGFPKSMDVGKAIDKVRGKSENFQRMYAKAVKDSRMSHAEIDRELGIKSSSCYWVRTDERKSFPTRENWEKLKHILPFPDNADEIYDEAERLDRVVGRYGDNSIYDKSKSVLDAGTPITQQAKQWDGWGTCLKPAWEPIIVARKPLDGTVAHNVMTYGTGAINIDGCRVGTETMVNRPAGNKAGGNSLNMSKYGMPQDAEPTTATGRFPANLVHDGSQEVLELIGDAQRFFYCAKASKRDRGEGNDHPTVKPNALMRWLVRLVCPQGGTVLDPFMGSGSTGVACIQEGMRFVGIDMDEHYCEIAEKRIGAEPDTVFAGALWASM